VEGPYIQYGENVQLVKKAYKGVPFSLEVSVSQHYKPVILDKDENIYFDAINFEGTKNSFSSGFHCNGNKNGISGGGGNAYICKLQKGTSSFTLTGIIIDDTEVKYGFSNTENLGLTWITGSSIYAEDQPDKLAVSSDNGIEFFNEEFYLMVESVYSESTDSTKAVRPVVSDTAFKISTSNGDDEHLSGILTGVIPAGQSNVRIGPLSYSKPFDNLSLDATFVKNDSVVAKSLSQGNTTLSVKSRPASSFTLLGTTKGTYVIPPDKSKPGYFKYTKSSLQVMQKNTLTARQDFSITVASVNVNGLKVNVDKDIEVQLYCPDLNVSNSTEPLKKGTKSVEFKGINSPLPGRYVCTVSSPSIIGSPGSFSIDIKPSSLYLSKGISNNTSIKQLIAGQPFSITVYSHDTSGNVFLNQYPINVSLSASSGTLSGNLSKTIAANTHSVEFKDLVHSGDASDLTITASSYTSGVNTGISTNLYFLKPTFSIKSISPISPVLGQPFSVEVIAVVGAAKSQFTPAKDTLIKLSSKSNIIDFNLQSEATIKSGVSSVTFTNLKAKKLAPFILEASAEGFANAHSNEISVLSSFEVSPSNASGNGTCPGDKCSLQGAIIAANSIQGGATITLDAGIYELNSHAMQINQNIKIQGAGSSSTFINGGSSGTLDITPQVFHINSGAIVMLDDLTIQNANTSSAIGHSQGGAIYNQGTLSLKGIVLNNNTSDLGGAIYSTGTLNIANSTFSDNLAGGVNGGGAIFSSGTLNLSSSTFYNNKSSGSGASGADITLNGNAIISNSTFSDSGASGNGGAINTWSGSALLINNTFSKNTASNGGAVFSSGITTLQNNIFSGQNNCAQSAHGSINSLGNNISSDSSCGGQSSDKLNADPMLSELANNGGDIKTISLQAGSPAINFADSTACKLSPVNQVDQRGVSRPVSACDAGAYQSAP